MEMKPWLFDILACPIDKHWPLKLHIFSFETESDIFNQFLKIYEERDLEIIKNEGIIKSSKKNETLWIKDNVIIEETPVKTYLELIIASIDELDHVSDNSSHDVSKKCLRIINTEIKEAIRSFLSQLNSLDRRL